MIKLQKSLPHFSSKELLQRALTHRSYVNEHPEKLRDNERLEFLGDAILNFLSGEFLYKKYPQKPEGELTSLRSTLVDANQLAEFAQMLNLGEQLCLGRGAERDGGRQNLRILSSTFEAVIGAYFLDCNYDINPVRNFVLPFFEAIAARLNAQAGATSVYSGTVNYKSRFQEWALAHQSTNPTYVVVQASGPDHAKTFVVEVRICEQWYGQGSGPKKQEAEKDAARDALDRLGLL